MHAGILVAGVFVALAMGACAPHRPWDSTPVPARDTPSFFVADPSFSPLPSQEQRTCLVHVRDPRDDTRLTLKRSLKREDPVEYLGDYAVQPVGRFGVMPGELLRLDCATGRAIGRVPEK